MFPFCCVPYACHSSKTREHYRQYQLEFLRTTRDHLEASLSAVNAAISTIEAQDNLADPQEGDAT